jgi:DNA polymerase delta subunit 1
VRQTTVFSGARPIFSITVANKRSLWGYKGDAVSPFLKITVAELKSYPKVRNAFERGEVSFRNFFEGAAVMTFESNIAYTLRFMIDHHVRTAEHSGKGDALLAKSSLLSIFRSPE